MQPRQRTRVIPCGLSQPPTDYSQDDPTVHNKSKPAEFEAERESETNFARTFAAGLMGHHGTAGAAAAAAAAVAAEAAVPPDYAAMVLRRARSACDACWEVLQAIGYAQC